MKDTLKKIREDLNKDNSDVNVLQQNIELLKNRIEKLENSVIPMYEKMFEQYKDPKTGKYIDPESGEDKTFEYKKILDDKKSELEECKKELKNCEEKLLQLLEKIKKASLEAKKTAAAQKVTNQDKKELRKEQRSIHSSTISNQAHFNTTRTNIYESTSRVKSNHGLESIQNTQVDENSSDPNELLKNVKPKDALLIQELKTKHKNGEEIDFSNPEVKDLLNKPETAKELLKTCPECFAEIPVELIEQDPKLFEQIFNNAVNERYDEIQNGLTKSATQEAEELDVQDPELIKQANEFLKQMRKLYNQKQDELEERESSAPVRAKSYNDND